MKNGSEKVVEEKVTWRGWISLFILIGRLFPPSVPAFLFVVPPRKKSSTQVGARFAKLEF